MCHFSCAPTIFLYFNLRINKYNLPSNDFEENLKKMCKVKNTFILDLNALR
jgi:hypothetical protein